MGEGRGNAGLIAFVAFVGLLALAALAVGLTALIEPRLDDDSESGTGTTNVVVNAVGSSESGSELTYLIQIGDDWGAHEFRNDEGFVEGFSKDMVYAICEAAGISCRVSVGTYVSAWATDNSGGEGLLAGWNDGCFGWLATPERLDVFDISDPYLAQPEAYFFVKNGGSMDTSDLSGKKIAFLAGWTSSPECVSRQASIANSDLDPDTQILTYTSLVEWRDAILNDAVDAGFCDIGSVGQYVDSGDLDTVAPIFYCAVAGNALMVKKDRSELLEKFNTGIKIIMDNGKYQEICDEDNIKYAAHGVIPCL